MNYHMYYFCSILFLSKYQPHTVRSRQPDNERIYDLSLHWGECELLVASKYRDLV